MQNKLNIENLSCNELKDIINIYMYGLSYMNKLGNRSVVDGMMVPLCWLFC